MRRFMTLTLGFYIWEKFYISSNPEKLKFHPHQNWLFTIHSLVDFFFRGKEKKRETITDPRISHYNPVYAVCRILFAKVENA